MVVILILPSSNEQQQTPPAPPPASTTSINGCDQYRSNGPCIINKTHPSTHQHNGNRTRKHTSAPRRITFQTDPPPTATPINEERRLSATGVPSAAAYTATTTATTSKNFVRHITRVNISDVYSQIEIDGDVEPVTKEGKSFPNLKLFIFFRSVFGVKWCVTSVSLAINLYSE